MSELPDPEYADPNRYAELSGFDGDYRDLWWNQDFLGLLAQRWQLDQRKSLLDIGCGAGHWGLRLLSMAPPDAHLSAVDREPSFLRLADQRAQTLGLEARCNFTEGSAESLPFPDNHFDLVTCQTVLIHVADPAVVAAEMARVLRPGGVAITCEPDNLAGNLALLGDSLETSDEDTLEIIRFLQCCNRGKRELGEGDERVGHRLPGLLSDAGLTAVRSFVNDRCMQLLPPHEHPHMRLALEQELSWARQGIPIIAATEHDARRRHRAGQGETSDFEAGWDAVKRWMEGFMRESEAGRFRAARGFVLYVVSALKP